MFTATYTSDAIYPQTFSERMTMIKITTMDDALGEKLIGMLRNILLKIDVQGFEDPVLRGGLKVLSQCQVVLLEVGVKSLYQEQANFRFITNLLYDVGFKYAGNLDQVYSQNGSVVYLDAVFKR